MLTAEQRAQWAAQVAIMARLAIYRPSGTQPITVAVAAHLEAVERERDDLRRLAGELAAAMSVIADMCGCNSGCCAICDLATHGGPPDGRNMDELLASPAVRALLEAGK